MAFAPFILTTLGSLWENYAKFKLVIGTKGGAIALLLIIKRTKVRTLRIWAKSLQIPLFDFFIVMLKTKAMFNGFGAIYCHAETFFTIIFVGHPEAAISTRQFWVKRFARYSRVRKKLKPMCLFLHVLFQDSCKKMAKMQKRGKNTCSIWKFKQNGQKCNVNFSRKSPFNKSIK